MARIGMTEYDLLVSCPSDVVSYLEVIEDVVEVFNNSLGIANKSRIVIRHWSKDSYPESGGRPQELLNKQFIEECDAAIALFWTKFGTPTGEYNSGSEEEIELMLSLKKQVFMYFVDEPIIPSQVNNEQYQRVIEFREKYSNRGIYNVVGTKEQFKTELTNHISQHFLKVFMNSSDISVGEKCP